MKDSKGHSPTHGLIFSSQLPFDIPPGDLTPASTLIFFFLSTSSLLSFMSFITAPPPPPIHVSQDGTAPLWMAAQMGHSEVVKVLLLRGADRDADRQVCSSFRIQKVHKTVRKEIISWCHLVPSSQTRPGGSLVILSKGSRTFG